MDHRTWIFLLCLIFFQPVVSAGQQASNQDADMKIRYLRTADGIEFGIWGSTKTREPAPLLFILSATIKESLGSKYFRQCGDLLAKEYGWQCVSIDLPHHGSQRKGKEAGGLDGWAEAARLGKDFVADNNRRMKKVLDYLIEQGHADTSCIAVCGTSRGGYLAFHFAAEESRVKSVLAFAPVTDLLALREFKGIEKSRLMPSMDLYSKMNHLADKSIWIVIGDEDERVGTAAAVHFMHGLIGARSKNNSKSRIEFNVMHEPRGHTTPAGAVERALSWVLQEYPPETE